MLNQYELKNFQEAYLSTLLELLDEGGYYEGEEYFSNELYGMTIFDFTDETLLKFQDNILNPFLLACESKNINLAYESREFSIEDLASDLCLTCSGYGTDFLDREIYNGLEETFNLISENIPFYYAVKGDDGNLYLE